MSTAITASTCNKVASVGIIFWLIKMMSTTMGETGADFLIFKLHWGLKLTSLVMLVPLVLILLLQLRAKRYHHSLYWLSVVLVSIVGTLVTDLLTDYWHVPLWLSSLVFGVLLLVIFRVWFLQEKTLSITSINTRPRELFYWAAILITFAMGTAVGDLFSEDLDWGYLKSIYIFGGIIALVALFYVVFKINVVLCFWIAYVLTRPLGASVGDFLSHSVRKGGLGFGTTNTSLVFMGIIILLVAYLTFADSERSSKNLTI